MDHVGRLLLRVSQPFQINLPSQYWISFIIPSVGSLNRSSLLKFGLGGGRLVVSTFYSLSYYPPHEILFGSSLVLLLDDLGYPSPYFRFYSGGRFSKALVDVRLSVI